MTDAIARMQRDLFEARQIAIDAIGMMAQRGTKLDELVEQANSLAAASHVYLERTRGRTSPNARMHALLGAIVLLSASLLLYVFFCV